jgi:antirestriction protein ArdC
MPSQNEIRAKITNTIIESLTKGNLPPWRMPWRNDPNAGAPVNVVSGNRYRGINPLILQCASLRHNLTSKYWGTFNQWKQLNGRVMRRPNNVPAGEWGSGIIFWSKVTKVEENRHGEEEEKDIFFLRQYTLFNVDQVEGEHLDHLRVGHTVTSTNPIDTYIEADRAIEATGADIRYGGNRAYYDRKGDYIQVPLREQFTAGEYYETIFHELCHWSEPRLKWNRKEEGYPLGELVAEIGSCFLAAELGIPTADTLPNHASYMQSWLKAMQNDTQFIFKASSQASKSANFILSFSRVEQPEEVSV